MKKAFKTGFTLAEVLVAMGVIGVIMTMTIPTLVDGANNRKNAAALGRSVEAIESGCQSLIQHASERSTSGEFFGHYSIHKDLSGNDIGGTDSYSVTNSSKLFDNAADYFNVVPLTTSQVSNYKKLVKSYSGSSPSPTVDTIATKFAVSHKLGAYYGVKSVTESSITDPIVEYIYIDVNGIKSPNRYGKDVFLFGLTDSCHMVPAGTGRIKGLVSSIPKYDSNGCNSGTPSNGLSCTARIVKEGYKMNY